MGEWLLADRSFFLKSTRLFLFLTYIKLIALLAVCLSLCTLMACEISSGKDTNEEQKTEVSDKVSGGKISRDEHKHVYARATCEEPATCACGETAGDKLGHNFSDATCTDPKICRRCGVAEGKSLSHDYVSATCTTAKTCKRCNLVSGEALGHDFTAANCTNPEICKRCELAQGSALGHDFAEATCTAPETCRTCGKTGAAAKGHTYTDDTCIRCGEVDPDSLPVGLEELHLMDSKCYEFVDKITDSFGKEHEKAHQYDDYDQTKWSLHALSKAYNTFSGTIATVDETPASHTFTFEIYVDEKLVYSYEDYKITTGAIDFSVDVSGGSSLEIVVIYDDHNRNFSEYTEGIALINAQLYK